MYWGGALRGAVAYGTAIIFPSQYKDVVVNTTAWVVLFTIFVNGGSTTSLLDKLGIPTGVEPEEEKDEETRHRLRVGMTHQAERESKLKWLLAQLDRNVLRKCLYSPEVRKRRRYAQTNDDDEAHSDTPLNVNDVSEPSLLMSQDGE